MKYTEDRETIAELLRKTTRVQLGEAIFDNFHECHTGYPNRHKRDTQYDIDEAFLATYLKQVKEYLKQTSGNYGYDVGMIGNLSYKLKALQSPLSDEQKEMTDFELFKVGNRAWAKRFSPNEIWMMNQLKGMIKAQKLDFDMLEPFFEARLEPTERTQMIRELQLKLYGY